MKKTHGKLLGIGPGELGEFLNRDRTTVILVLKSALVNDIGGFLTALGDDELGAEVVCCGFEVGERELREARCASGSGGGGVGSVRGVRMMVVLSLSVFESGVGFFERRRCTTAHNSVELTQ